MSTILDRDLFDIDEFYASAERKRTEDDQKGGVVRVKYSDDQERDYHGRWTGEGGGYSPGMAPAASAVQMRKGAPPTSRRKVVDVAHMFDEGGPVEWDVEKAKTPEERAMIEANIEHAIATGERELRYQLSLENDFKNWYSQDVRDAFEITQQHIPSLADPQKRALFSIVAGIAANGTDPTENWNIASKIFDEYERTGTMPARNPETDKLWSYRPDMERGLEALDKMIKSQGEASAVTWLLTEHTGWQRDLAKVWYGGQAGGALLAQQESAIGAVIFGPKIGPFISNLNGLHNVTVDKWATRSFNRWFRSSTEMRTEKGITALAVKDTPETPRHRELISDVFSKASVRAGILPEQGQAGLWFFEQQLYTQLGAKSRPDSFSDGARKFDAGKRGLPTTAAEARAEARKKSYPDYDPDSSSEIRDEAIRVPTDEELRGYKWIGELMLRQIAESKKASGTKPVVRLRSVE